MVTSLLALIDGLKLTGQEISSSGRLAYSSVYQRSNGDCGSDTGGYCHCPEDNNCDCNPSGAYCDCHSLFNVGGNK